jgi:membrane glycosyltransferase
MFVSPIAPAVAYVAAVGTLGRRRTLFASVVGATLAGLLWLAATAVPPRGAGSILFLALFSVTLPWSVVGFWNAIIGFLIMSCAHDPVAAVNPMAARVRGDEKLLARTAVLACIRNENPNQVTRNLRALLDGLAAAGVAHLFHVYVLSDSNDPDIIANEYASITVLAEEWRETISVT